ncbi:MAG: glycoside hydrolase family 88 protein [Verrucomicrobiales bacterium]|nr:glycoside hydrolase family 88 protein [Verrucomicrobiales bacterium]
MPLHIDRHLTPRKLLPAIDQVFELSGRKILSLERTWNPAQGAPVFTVRGRYTTRGWTEWTQGFQFGAAFLQFDATHDEAFLQLGRQGTLAHMARHVSHTGVHDHGFNNVSTYGNLWRLLLEKRLPANPDEQNFCELALKLSGAIQAARWTRLADGTGFIHSFNGPHSLFVDTLRSGRALALAHLLGHVLLGEQDARISLLDRLLEHTLNTARYNIYYGTGRDAYDVRGRTAHEAVFNTASGAFRCPNTQQGYSPFSTWTRGLAWAICGFAEQLEFLRHFHQPTHTPSPTNSIHPAHPHEATLLEAARATADFYLAHCCADGIPFWDTGAPNLHRLPPDHLDQPADPSNRWEPVDSSAAAIAAQGLIRLGNYLAASPHPCGAGFQPAQSLGGAGFQPAQSACGAGFQPAPPRRQAAVRIRPRPAPPYKQAGLTIARTLFAKPYLSTHPRHQGLLLHSVYHRPNGWDHIPPGTHVPHGESSMWGDYHARELALLIRREARGEPYLTFFAHSR